MAELEAVQPQLIVCLGATAARSIFGGVIRILKLRGKILPTPDGRRVLVTVYPSSLLRAPRGPDADAAFAQFVRDLEKINQRRRTNAGR